MTPLIFSNVAARWIGYAMLLLAYGVEIGTGSRAGRTDALQDAGTKYFLLVVMSASVVGAIVLAYKLPATAMPGNPWIVFGTGCLLVLLGTSLRRWAIAVLGRFFTRDVMIREAHEVVTRGPFRVLRHPAYSGTMVIMLGFGLMLGSWLSLIIIAVGFVVSHLPRILHEEHVLEANLGAPYREFERTRKRLIPFVW
jgi:protein-S-isoprenylcysteine O-methyltransferase Ste14